MLVTGATGFTGSALVRTLHRRGYGIRALVRPSSDRRALAGLPVDWVIGDVFDPATVERATRDVDFVFNVAAAYRDPSISDAVYERVHVTATELLARGAARNLAFKRFVQVSTVGVLGHIEHPPADESTPYNPGDVYQITKMKGEVALRTYAQSVGLPYVIVRPAAIYGPGDRRLLKLFRLARLPIVPLVGNTQGLYHLVHVQDLAEFLWHVSVSESCIGELFICGEPRATSIREIVTTVAQYLGRKPRFVRLPSGPAFAAAALCEKVCPLLGLTPPLYQRRVAFFTKDRAFDTRKMRGVGFECRHSGPGGWLATAAWYRSAGWL